MLAPEVTAIAHNISKVRALIMRLEGERVFDWEAWVFILYILALYNAENGWRDAVRRMNTARKNAEQEVWGETCLI